MGRKRKKINQHYFDKKTENQWYVEGLFHGCYRPKGFEGIRFTSKDVELVELVHKELEVNYDIQHAKKDRQSHWFEVKHASHVREYLDKRGVSIQKSSRSFPNKVPKKYLRDIVRGITESASCIGIKNNIKYLQFYKFNNEFHRFLHQILVEHAKVERDNPGKILTFGHNDRQRIVNWMYYPGCLHLESKKQQLQSDYITDGHSPKKDLAAEKAMMAKILFDQEGLSTIQVAKALGYSHRNAFNNMFKRETGMTPTEFQEQLKNGN